MQTPNQQGNAPPQGQVRYPDRYLNIPYTANFTGTAASALEHLMQQGKVRSVEEALNQGILALYAVSNQQGQPPQQFQGFGMQPQQQFAPQQAQPSAPASQVAQLVATQMARMNEEMEFRRMLEMMKVMRDPTATSMGSAPVMNAPPTADYKSMVKEVMELRALNALIASQGGSDPNASAVSNQLQERIRTLETALARKDDNVALNRLESRLNDLSTSITAKLGQPQAQDSVFQKWTLDQMAMKDKQLIDVAGQAQDVKFQMFAKEMGGVLQGLGQEISMLRQNAIQSGAAPKEGELAALGKNIDQLTNINNALAALKTSGGGAAAPQTEGSAIVSGLQTLCSTIKPLVDKVGSKIAERMDVETQQAALKRQAADTMDLQAKKAIIESGLVQNGVNIVPPPEDVNPGAPAPPTDQAPTDNPGAFPGAPRAKPRRGL